MEKLDSCGLGCRVFSFRLFWKHGRRTLACAQPGGHQIEMALTFSLYLLSECLHHSMCVVGSGQLIGVDSLYYVSPWDETQIVKLVGKCPYLLSLFTGPETALNVLPAGHSRSLLS